MEIRYLTPLSDSWERCKATLFRPFDLWKWLVIGFAAWLAGLMRGGNGPGGQWKVNEPGNVGDAFRGAGQAVERSVHRLMDMPWTGLLIVFGVLAVLVIVLVLLWVSSRGKFIFLDNVVTNRAGIVEPWKRYGRLGDSLFLWRLGFGVASVLVIAVIVACAIGAAVLLAAGKHLGAGGLLVVAMFALVVVAVALSILFVGMCVENFIIPIMYRFNLGVLDAWRSFLPWLRRYLGAFVAYWIFVILLAIGLGITVMIFGLLTCCIGLILVWLPYIGTVLLLPIWVTYRSLGPEFLAQFDDGLSLFREVEPEGEVVEVEAEE